MHLADVGEAAESNALVFGQCCAAGKGVQRRVRSREHRHKVMIGARMRAGGLPANICIRDISSKGMMIHSGASPPRGTYVEIVTPSQTIVGRVVWGNDFRFGIQTRERLQIDMMISGLRCDPALPEERPAIAHREPGRTVDSAAIQAFQARAFEFLTIIVFAIALVATFGMAAYRTLAQPIGAVASEISGGP